MAYLGLVAGAVTMVAQTWAQARMDPTRAAVIMAMEPVWAAGFAVALGGEVVTVRLVVGGLAILAAIYLAELWAAYGSGPGHAHHPARSLTAVSRVYVGPWH